MTRRLPMQDSSGKRTEAGHTPLEVFQYVIWGPGAVERRIWNAARTPEWRLPWLQFSTWGEVVGWARPDDYPPRNDRTLKGPAGPRLPRPGRLTKCGIGCTVLGGCCRLVLRADSSVLLRSHATA